MTQPTPNAYICADCGASGVKLWRLTHVFADEVVLRCRACTVKVADPPRYSFSVGDQIGSHTPAIPAMPGTFWGYTSAPLDAVLWWYDLDGLGRWASVDEGLTPAQERRQYLLDTLDAAERHPHIFAPDRDLLQQRRNALSQKEATEPCTPTMS